MASHRRSAHQRAEATLRIGRARARLRVEMSAGGIVAVGALVSAILLSTAVVVRTAQGGAPRALPKREA